MVAIHCEFKGNALILAILFFALATPLVAQDATASDPQSGSETGDAHACRKMCRIRLPALSSFPCRTIPTSMPDPLTARRTCSTFNR